MKRKSKPKKNIRRPKKTEKDFEIPKIDKHHEIDEVEASESVEELAEKEGEFEDDSEILEEDRF